MEKKLGDYKLLTAGVQIKLLLNRQRLLVFGKDSNEKPRNVVQDLAMHFTFRSFSLTVGRSKIVETMILNLLCVSLLTES